MDVNDEVAIPEKKISGRVRSGKARMAKLTPEQRTLLAKEAAMKRWSSPPDTAVIAATHMGNITLADGAVSIPCAVLEDGTRVLSRIGFIQAIGRTGKAKGGRKYDQESKLPVFLTASNLKPFIPDKLSEDSSPIPYKTLTGGVAMGYKAELLPTVCNVFLDAKHAGVLHDNQEHIAEQCRILNRAFSVVAVTALIDEATGYQYDRARDSLAKILEAFIAKELKPWVRTFPDEFYKQLFRLRGLEFPRDSVKKPQYFGHLTNNIVYARLAPLVLEELQRTTPRTPRGRLKHHLHRRLTDDIGHPKLREHLASVTSLMKISSSYQQFEDFLQVAHPRYNETMTLDLVPEEVDDGKGL